MLQSRARLIVNEVEARRGREVNSNEKPGKPQDCQDHQRSPVYYALGSGRIQGGERH